MLQVNVAIKIQETQCHRQAHEWNLDSLETLGRLIKVSQDC